MRREYTSLWLLPVLALACADPDRRTLADLHRVEPDVREVTVDDGLGR